MTRARRTVMALLAVAVGVGCSTSQPGVKNVAGMIQTVLAATPLQVHAAAQKQLEAMQVKASSSAVTTIDGRLVGRTALDREITIEIAQETERVTKVRIYVSPGGDVPLSLMILDGIKARLP